jgi:asparagine synthase (glutamine-hydrolysing)
MMYLISRQARDHITVALCGAGGDELYGGYPRYRAMALSDLTRWIPLPLLHGMASGLRWIPDSSHSARRRRIESFFGGLDRDAVRQYLNWTYYFSEAQKGELLRFPESPCESSLQRFRKVYDDCAMQEVGDRLLELDVQTFLVDNLLEYTDKMSMAVPLEMRVPLLDHEFVEFSLNVPFGDKLSGSDTKLPLKRAFREFFTPDALNAPKKGFIPPLADWMKNSFDLYFEDRPSAVRDEHRRGVQDWSYELFAIMIYDLWYGKHFD